MTPALCYSLCSFGIQSDGLSRRHGAVESVQSPAALLATFATAVCCQGTAVSRSVRLKRSRRRVEPTRPTAPQPLALTLLAFRIGHAPDDAGVVRGGEWRAALAASTAGCRFDPSRYSFPPGRPGPGFPLRPASLSRRLSIPVEEAPMMWWLRLTPVGLLAAL